MIGGAIPLGVFARRASVGYFPAGYAFRRRVVLPAAVHRLSVADGSAVVPFLETQDFFRTVANGGRVASATGDDIRFETEGRAKIPHDLTAYAPTTGRVEAWLRVPTFDTVSDVLLVVAYGNAAVSSPEADPAATWTGFRWSVDLATGRDAGPLGLHLTMTDVLPGTILGQSAGDFSGV